MTLEELVATHGQALLRIGLMLTGNLDDAQDLLQATLVRLLGRNLDGVRSLPAYAHRTLVNEYLSGRRRASRREVPVPEPPQVAAVPGPGGPGGPGTSEWRLLAHLPRQQRAVLVLRYYEDRTDAEIADLLGCREATVRSYAARGLDTLRQRVGTRPSLTGGSR